MSEDDVATFLTRQTTVNGIVFTTDTGHFFFFFFKFLKKKYLKGQCTFCRYPYVTFFHSILPASLLGLNWLSL